MVAPTHSTAVALGRIEASIMGESALIDRETGRVFWEGGGSTTLFENLFSTKLDSLGAEHAQAALLTAVISVACLGVVVSWMRRLWGEGGAATIHSPDLQVEGWWRAMRESPMHMILTWTLWRLPRIENQWLVVATMALYLLESYNCTTRRFLTNAIVSPREVETYIEELRSEEPIVTWLVRSFHYEKRWILAVPNHLQDSFRKVLSKGKGRRGSLVSDAAATALETLSSPTTTAKHCPPMFPFTKKVVTNEAKAHYHFQSCIDNTIAGVWKRAEALSLSDSAGAVAPFTKISLSKLLVLQDRKSREDYFRQQSEFVTEHGRGDECTEFSTDIQVAGYRPRVLAVRPIEGMASTKLFRSHVFWCFTCLGLTVPFRIWFKRHCDSLRVTVVKETSSSSFSSSYWASTAGRWLPSRTSLQPYYRREGLLPGVAAADTATTSFRTDMQGRSLYTMEELPTTSTSSTMTTTASTTTTERSSQNSIEAPNNEQEMEATTLLLEELSQEDPAK